MEDLSSIPLAVLLLFKLGINNIVLHGRDLFFKTKYFPS